MALYSIRAILMTVAISIVERINNYNLKLSCHLGPFTSEWKQFPFFFLGISRCCGFTVIANRKLKPIEYLLEGALKMSLFFIVKPICHVG